MNATTHEQKQKIINKLFHLWIKNPDLRLGQLLTIAIPNNELHWILNVEDFDLIETLESFLEEI